MQRRLYRSERDRMIGGVCGGIAAYLDIDPVWIRLAFAILVLASGVGLLAYVVLWIIVPTESRVEGQIAARETVAEGVSEIRDRARELGEGIREGVQSEGQPRAEPPRRQTGHRGALIVGGLLMLVGVLILLENFHFIAPLNLRMLWPLILIALGAALLLRRR